MANGPPSRRPLEHTKTTKKCRSPSSEADRDARRDFAEFPNINNDAGFFTNVIVGWMEIVVGSVRFDASRTALTTFARSSCH